jgi:hypothetical protein
MNKIFLFLGTVLCICTVNKAVAQSFSAVNADGKTIYYNITSTTTVEVRNNSREMYNGIINIPSTVTDGTNTYTVTAIGYGAFENCDVTSVTIPNSVTIIGGSAFASFYYPSSLTSVNIPDSVTTIGDFAFSSCNGLTDTLTISNLVTTIGEFAFYNCSNLTFISVDENNTLFSSNNGVLFNKDQTALICCPAGKTGNYTIPNSVTFIESAAFINCSGLTGTLTIHDSVKDLGASANFGYDIFSGCSGLTSLIIGNSITTLGVGIFAYCTGLTSVTIGNSVTTIDEYVFYHCGRITEIYVKALTPPSVGVTTFYGVSTSIRVYVPCGSVTAYKNAGWNFPNLTERPKGNISVKSNDNAMGRVSIQANTCTNDTAIISATPNTGYRFVEWNDGDTNNPRSITVTQDTNFMAIFGRYVSITDIEAPAINVYPNPAKDNITIILPEGNSNMVFTLYDMQGKALIKQDINNNKDVVDISRLAAGIYLYNLTYGKQDYKGKVVKK